MDNYGTSIEYFDAWEQYIGYMCGNYQFFDGDFWPLDEDMEYMED